jgi:3-hydroxyethyl bacteriochlorophyllide a dehydrogenase
MDTLAVVLEQPERLALRRLGLTAPAADDVVVQVDWSGISTGTERLLWSGRMPPFPGLGYPLVPGYEAVGRVVAAGELAQARIGDRVFVPGSSSFIDARGLFGGSARTLVTPQARAVSLPETLGEAGVLLSLAATAQHAIAGGSRAGPDRWPRHAGAAAQPIDGRRRPPRADHLGDQPGPAGQRGDPPGRGPRRDYRSIYDASGDAGLLDALVGRLARGGEIVLAGFYEDRLSFAFPPAFMREARLRIAAEFRPEDTAAVLALLAAGAFSLDGLITHRADAADASDAYRTAFGDPGCLKMILDWSACA